MVKQKYYKNLYQMISSLSVVMVFVLFLLIGYFSSLNYESNNGFIILIVIAILLIMYFVIGFYWIFQKVIINENGIKIVLLNKTIKLCLWEEILSIEETTIMKNPAIRIKKLNGSEIHLDNRKKIKLSIEHYKN